MDGKPCFILRASDFPPNRKNQTAQAFRKFRDGGGRQFLVPIPEWERMMMVREFYNHHRNDPGFAAWFSGAKLLSRLVPMTQLLRLDLLGFGVPNLRTGRRARRSAARHRLALAQQAGSAQPIMPEAAVADDDQLRFQSFSTRTAGPDRASWRDASSPPHRGPSPSTRTC
jgi:hypothetical protein